ncbi:hypothetical protein CONPUDRAFT_78001 [Coniophora puteana RWD-64-598 SS2]|uniref:DUF6534 domain-containing protein n=1 Tax=Coniophora puteana (strain RWD-64-598) TaxID=741705 RepID=R7SEN5_CONPW|nr:uncharacterized protein CONPUDRAFT_78001 [Coniophora puteana RWD-64-598 SS2]EIW74325.1 hypothetical protein CONPUDRAFT_78001 [Coniophora puteana RWD-64-598 SS2]
MVIALEETLAVTLPNLNSTMGALLVGSFLATLLYGITSHQFFRYFRMYPRDEVSLKAMVGGLWSLQVAVTITSQAVITLITHCFFAQRIYHLNGGNWIFPSILVLPSVLAFSGASNVTIALGSAAISDTILSVALCYYLRNQKNNFFILPFSVDKATVCLINTGVLTSILIVADVICAASMPHNLIYLGLYFVVSKLSTPDEVELKLAKLDALILQSSLAENEPAIEHDTELQDHHPAHLT